ncbi:chaoptin-like [Pollicipes pollicipes]|uniref:chaoptin-like n=1 Tax=Pollicipes pollicipes TaxID=41117 RepID=UPI001884EC58|nr:chaoptin-like [Pollicipes pollicipes]
MRGLLLALLLGAAGGQQAPCRSLPDPIDLPCLCARNAENGTDIVCDNVVFQGDFPLLPFRAAIHSFSQRNVGYQRLPAQVFTAASVPLRKLDFSRNVLNQLTGRLLDGLEDTLEEVYLGFNQLGDQLNPIFSTSEFRGLTRLKILDLRSNGIKVIDEGILDGCEELQVLRLEGNQLETVPSGALAGPRALTVLTLQDNHIDQVQTDAFLEQPALRFLNISSNRIRKFQFGAFTGLAQLKRLYLAYNKLQQLGDSDLAGLQDLEHLDISNNFLTSIPSNALRRLTQLKTLILHSNLIQGIEAQQLTPLASLEVLDLTRNNIANLAAGTFEPLVNLRELRLGVNMIRQGDDGFQETFRGLDRLETLNLDDNGLLYVPHAALRRLTGLRRLSLDHNRIGVIARDKLSGISGLEELSLAYNVIRELPAGTFQEFGRLRRLSLRGNQVPAVSQDVMAGVDATLEELDLGLNRISRLQRVSFPKLRKLSLEGNQISDVDDDAFELVDKVQELDLSDNRLESVPERLLQNLTQISNLDLSNNRIEAVQSTAFSETNINVIQLQNNRIQEVPEQAFVNLPFLHTLDLSGNNISLVRNGAFSGVPFLHILKLDSNRLATFKADFFNITSDGTELRILDLSKNEITFLYPAAFKIHSNLRWLNLGDNKLEFFPAELLADATKLEYLDLEANNIESISSSDYANMPHLRQLILKGNNMTSINQTAFQNSTQLQFIDLSHNNLTELHEDTFSGLVRLALELNDNQLSALPDDIFTRLKLQMLQKINLANNQFEEMPLDALRKQFIFLDDVNMSGNRIRSIPPKEDILANVKILDLSFNPLTPDSIEILMNEPKAARELHLAGTGVTAIPVLETPYLRKLNLSGNAVQKISENLFERPSLLQSIDLSFNQIPNLSFGLATVWPRLRFVRELDVSGNPISYVIRGDFTYLNNLEVLRMTHLDKCSRIEKTAFQSLPSLRELQLHSYPGVTNLDIKGILEKLNTLEALDVEVKEPVLQDQLHPSFFPRLRRLGVHGRAVRSISTGALAGLSSPRVLLLFSNTSIGGIPTKVLLPVPLSTTVELDVTDSRLTSVGPQLLSQLDDRQRSLSLRGLPSNPIYCDCNAAPLRRWLLAKRQDGTMADAFSDIRCQAPAELAGRLLVELAESRLTCSGRETTTTTEIAFTTRRTTTTAQPDIIWTLPPRRPAQETEPGAERDEAEADTAKQAGVNNMDALIIGIVGGVVALIILVIVCVCVCRLCCFWRWDSSREYQGGPLAGPLALRGQGGCTCLKPGPPQWNYLGYPSYPMLGPPPPPAPSSRNGTLVSAKMLGPPPPGSYVVQNGMYGTLSTLGGGGGGGGGGGPGSARGFYPNTPYYVTFPPESDNDQR